MHSNFFMCTKKSTRDLRTHSHSRSHSHSHSLHHCCSCCSSSACTFVFLHWFSTSFFFECRSLAKCSCRTKMNPESLWLQWHFFVGMGLRMGTWTNAHAARKKLIRPQRKRNNVRRPKTPTFRMGKITSTTFKCPIQNGLFKTYFQCCRLFNPDQKVFNLVLCVVIKDCNFSF